METEILKILTNEKEELSRERERNTEKIKTLDERIAECEKNARHYSLICCLNDQTIETYRKKTIFIKESMRFGLIKVISLAYENMRINFREKENRFFEEKRTYYQNAIIYYNEDKKHLERENITLGNKIFIIDDELNKDSSSKQKVLKREAK